MIGNDLSSRAGQVPYQLFASAALLRQMQSSGWRFERYLCCYPSGVPRGLAREILIGPPAGIHLAKIENAGVRATTDHAPFNVMSS